MEKMRPLALAKQVMAIPYHFVRHQWAHYPVSKPEKYSFGPHPRQHLLFWNPPKGAPEKQSIIVFYHGGGWRLGWPDQFPTIADWFLRLGYPVVMPAYRLSPKFAYPDMREDMNLAISQTIDLIASKRMPQTKILSAGMSAGATLAAHLAFNRSELTQLGLSQALFSGFLSIAGPLDLETLPDVAALRGFTRGRPGTSAFKMANPIHLIHESDTMPILLLHGNDDAIVPHSSSERFFQRYPGPKSLHLIPGGSHLDSLNFVIGDHSVARLIQDWLEKCSI